MTQAPRQNYQPRKSTSYMGLRLAPPLPPIKSLFFYAKHAAYHQLALPVVLEEWGWDGRGEYWRSLLLARWRPPCSTFTWLASMLEPKGGLLVGWRAVCRGLTRPCCIIDFTWSKCSGILIMGMIVDDMICWWYNYSDNLVDYAVISGQNQ